MAKDPEPDLDGWDWLDAPEAKAELVPAAEAKKLAADSPLALLDQELGPGDDAQERRLKSLQNDLHERAAGIIAGVLSFDEIDPENPPKEPPQAWIDELGLEGARRRLRVALGAWASQKNAPVGIKVATDVLAGIIAAKATEKTGTRVLNVGKVYMSLPMPEFEEIEVESK